MKYTYLIIVLAFSSHTYSAEQPYTLHLYRATSNGITVGALLASNKPSSIQSLAIDIAALRQEQSHHHSRLMSLESHEKKLTSTLETVHRTLLQRRWLCCRTKSKTV